ncbi:hypothetical protein OAS44_05980 [Flavobacteriaceae bacterium]|nr:hypothetical protein [Flavobacteriaceae bacterium]
MGGSGTMTAMNAVIKSKRKLRRNVNREKFKRTFGKYKSKGKPEYDFPKAQLHTIRRLKERMIYENEQIIKRRIIAFIAVSIILITVLFYIL